MSSHIIVTTTPPHEPRSRANVVIAEA